MFRGILFLCLAVLIVGCGSPKEESANFQGTVEKKDYTAIGYEYLKKGDVVKAVQTFDLAIRQSPKDPQGYLVLGEVYLRLKQYSNAEDTFTAATTVDPNNADAYYFLALSRLPQPEKKEKAVEAAKKSVELYMAQKNEDGFKRSLLLLKSMEPAASSVTEAVPSVPKMTQ